MNESIFFVTEHARIHRVPKFLGLPDLDPDPSIIKQKYIARKTLISTALCLLYDFLSLKKDVNVPSKSYKQKNEYFLLVY